MLELHLAAYASLSDRSPSILLPPACSKLPSTHSRATCCSPSPWKLVLLKFPFQRGCPALDASRLSPGAVGQGRSREWELLWDSQLRSCTKQDVISASSHKDSVLALQLLRDRASQSSHLPQPPLLSSFAFNYFFNIWGERSIWQEAILEQVPRRELSGNKPRWALVPL